MIEFTVIIKLAGAREWARKVPADNSRDALDRAWGLWATDVAHPTRMLAEHIGDLHVEVLAPVGAEWCPVCKTYHPHPGEKTDAGRLTRPCPNLPADDPRNKVPVVQAKRSATIHRPARGMGGGRFAV